MYLRGLRLTNPSEVSYRGDKLSAPPTKKTPEFPRLVYDKVKETKSAWAKLLHSNEDDEDEDNTTNSTLFPSINQYSPTSRSSTKRKDKPVYIEILSQAQGTYD